MTGETQQSSVQGSGALTGLRVIELGEGYAAAYTAKLLADFGADVIKVESPAGDPARLRGPYAGDKADPEASGLHAYLNTNKRSIVADVSQSDGLKTIKALLGTADILVTDILPARLGELGLGLPALRQAYPGLIITSITPFGNDGPWAKRRGDELVAYSMSGLAYNSPGLPDAAADKETEPPLHPGCFIAGAISGAAGAVATVSAVHTREKSETGCVLNVAQQAILAAVQHRDVNNVSYVEGPYRHSRVFNAATTGRMPNFYVPCKDGYVAIPAPLEAHWQALVEAMGSPEWAKTPDFDSAGRTKNWVELRQRITDWTMTVTSDELYAIAQQRGLLVFPFYSVRRMIGSPQVENRGSVVEVDIGGRKARMPGAPVKLAASPWALRRPAPRKGEHTAQVLAEAGALTPAATSGARQADRQQRLPLSGVRVLDFGQFIAVPFCTLWLAWMGAEVISVESRRRMTSRTASPYAAGHAGDPNASGYYNPLYSSKKSVTIDMTTDAGRALALKLAGAVDVMVDNYSSGVLEKLGLGYDVVSKLNPGIIALSCGAFGRTGPLRKARGLHSAVNLFSGVADVTGYPGGGPRILGGWVPDPIAGTYSAFAILSALRHKQRTGQGQFIDIAMYEALMTLIPEAVIDMSLNDRDPVRMGNRDKMKAPHGIYRCAGDDAWIAISVQSESDWAALCEAAGHPQWKSDPRFADMAARRANVAELDAAIDAWTRTMNRDAAVDALQARGVAAGPVMRPDELFDDAQFQSLGVVMTTDHPVAGKRRQLGLPWTSDTVEADYRRAPLLGEHTHEVLTRVAGISEEEYQRLDAEGVLQ